MASGTINLSTNNSKLAGKIDWWSSSNGSASNSSNIDATLYIRRTDGYTTTGTFSGRINIAGQEQTANVHTSVGSGWVGIVSIFGKKIQHNNDGKGSCGISGSCNGPTGTSLAGAVVSGSGTAVLDTIPRYASISHSLNSTGLTNIKMNWSSDSTCDLLQYSLNGGGWVTVSGNPYTISGLNPNTTYRVRTRVRRKDSQLYSQTGELSVKTKDIARISSASNFNHGDNTVVGITNPAGGTIKLRLIVGGTTIFNRNVSAGNNTIGFSDAELDNIYKKYGSGNSVTATFSIDTYNGSNIGWSNTKNVTISLRGNQKTIRYKVNGTYRRGKTWININGSWRRAVVWIKINGVWKRGI